MELNNRQINLYNYLLLKYDEERYISKKEICKDLPYEYPRHLETNKNEGNCSVAFFRISDDVKKINSNESIKHIIVSNKKGFKIANKEEARRYLESRFRRDLKSLKLDWQLKKKISSDGQLVMNGEVLETIETFIRNFG